MHGVGAEKEKTINKLKITIKENEELISQLQKMKDENRCEDFVFSCGANKCYEKYTDEKTRLNKGLVGKIGNFTISEPIMENGFLIILPDSLCVSETDVKSCEFFSHIVSVEIRNNIKCPVLYIEKVLKEGFLGNEPKIKIETIDRTGEKLYTTVFNISKLVNYTISNLSYGSDEPQKIRLNFEYTDYQVIKNSNAEKIINNAAAD